MPKKTFQITDANKILCMQKNVFLFVFSTQALFWWLNKGVWASSNYFPNFHIGYLRLKYQIFTNMWNDYHSLK